MEDDRSASLAGKSILIAEDSWHIAEAIKLAVAEEGGSIVGIAGTLARAEKLAHSVAFDAAVMDLDLRGQDATDLVLRLAEVGHRIVVLTGFECPLEFHDKVHACLTKPTPTEALISALSEACARYR